ncbi:protein PTHB1 isoform X1 [Hypanus sabinus]|uniref:protein PTHB1 isoform X1 n=1 Tax=Hypanus sabinus TaxID=79690 RepID=UPI0028C50A89|nr:protein PTHB1 isoform X1 [Hypanus sabinus]XP_059829568.1 protein PTHB1 isoform X1 [Hypanus sabinus]XP_059829576.1 protein PTHB1 isoform X1 [Hypanus sabinus]
MSLFKARDWWSTSVGEQEEFDQGCLCVANVDNTESDKIIIGSYQGILRIYSPEPSKPGAALQPEELILEVQLQDPILQVEVGKFVSGTELLHMAVLHPRKLSVHAVSGTMGTVEHGNQYQLKLIYEHNLQGTACNLTFGGFGGVKARDLICIQSMDGMLMFFEQESFAFRRFLPNCLLPGPLKYCTRTDSFITVSSSRHVESYKYQVLAVATDAESRHDSEQQKLGSGKRLTKDWTVNIGEQALDIHITTFHQAPSSILVLGERNLYCFKENGQLRFMKKLEYNPSCFLPYTSVLEGTINILIGNHNNKLLVYQDATLKWVAQLPHLPVCVQVANFQHLKGVVMTLSDSGHLQCSYLGTDPSFFQAPKVESRELNYDEMDSEMKELNKVIREATKTQDILPKMESNDDLNVTVVVSPSLDVASQAPDNFDVPVPSISLKVTVWSRLAVQDVKLSVCVQSPLAVTQDQLGFSSIEPGTSKSVLLSVFLKESFPPATLGGDVAVSYCTSTGVPRIAQCTFGLPLKLICQPVQPCKNAVHKITIDTNKPPVNIAVLFPDFLGESDHEQINVLGFKLLSGSTITFLASKTSSRYRVQCDQFEDLWLITKGLIQRLEEIFSNEEHKDFVCTFSGPIPLQEYFQLIDRHFELRLNAEKYKELLSQRALQYRAIQRRLLTHFKDKTPSPLHNLDTLLDGTYQQIIALADAMEENQANLYQAFTRVKSATQLTILLIGLWQNLSRDQMTILEAAFLPLTQDSQELGWEECVDAAVVHLLRTCLSRTSKDQALNPTNQLSMPKDTSRLKKHITLLCDRLSKGGQLSLVADAPQHAINVPGFQTIPESELEEKTADHSPSGTSQNPAHIRKSETGNYKNYKKHNRINGRPPPPIAQIFPGVLQKKML